MRESDEDFGEEKEVFSSIDQDHHRCMLAASSPNAKVAMLSGPGTITARSGPKKLALCNVAGPQSGKTTAVAN